MSNHIERIDHTSHYLKSVEQIYRAHAATLGMFPKGAFVEHAMHRQILVALAEDGTCMGYLLYRTSSRFQRASITHLCVDTTYRRLGVARALVDSLKQITQSYDGILATCRRDYDAHRMWPKLGADRQCMSDTLPTEHA